MVSLTEMVPLSPKYRQHLPSLGGLRTIRRSAEKAFTFADGLCDLLANSSILMLPSSDDLLYSLLLPDRDGCSIQPCELKKLSILNISSMITAIVELG